MKLFRLDSSQHVLAPHELRRSRCPAIPELWALVRPSSFAAYIGGLRRNFSPTIGGIHLVATPKNSDNAERIIADMSVFVG
ncbi:hypothetical protein [Cupriavidus metallidurans]|uniref:hypothetical protein n=1 Tax=Cupriavidus metallidurans TaxID=119219 RepID=UPI00190F6DCB|nr:hypothetical protein [Cupriavidus metallidurans]